MPWDGLDSAICVTCTGTPVHFQVEVELSRVISMWAQDDVWELTTFRTNQLTHFSLVNSNEGQVTHHSSTKKLSTFLALLLAQGNGFSAEKPSRRGALEWIGGTCAGLMIAAGAPSTAWGAAAVQDSVNVDAFIRTGMDIGGNMGVSSQAGKSRPETGVFLRDGSDVSRDSRTGNVLAEILLQKEGGGRMAALTSFSSPWPLATGSNFDVECRDGRSGDGAFLAVTAPVEGKTIAQVDDGFFLDSLLAPTGRFSFYGQPTDVRIKKSVTKGDYRVIDLSFSTLSQSTQTENPRKAQLIATIPPGSAQAVMLVGSASAPRWNKGSDKAVSSTIDSFRAIAAPETGMKLRKKDRGGQSSLSLDLELTGPSMMRRELKSPQNKKGAILDKNGGKTSAATILATSV
eukprot:scaffold1034_cov127-Cylindrotheca_fusiformis.AAC.11